MMMTETLERLGGTIQPQNAGVRSTGTASGTKMKCEINHMKNINKTSNGNRNEHHNEMHRSVPPHSLGGYGGKNEDLKARKRELEAEIKKTFRKSDDPKPKLKRASLVWQLRSLEKLVRKGA
jgi:hypothetical protein